MKKKEEQDDGYAYAKFQVPAEMFPGLARIDLGRVKPGQCFSWPKDLHVGDNPSIKLVPLNPEAYALLVKIYGAPRVKEQHGDMEVKQVVQEEVRLKKEDKVRASDSK